MLMKSMREKSATNAVSILLMMKMMMKGKRAEG